MGELVGKPKLPASSYMYFSLCPRTLGVRKLPEGQQELNVSTTLNKVQESYWTPSLLPFLFCFPSLCFLNFFYLFIYLFGYDGSQLPHMESSIFLVAYEIYFLTKDGTWAPSIGSAKFQLLVHQGSPVLYAFNVSHSTANMKYTRESEIEGKVFTLKKFPFQWRDQTNDYGMMHLISQSHVFK